MSCVLRSSLGASQADYYDLRYAWKTDTQSAVETFEDQDAHYFRFGGPFASCRRIPKLHRLFARCLAVGETPKPDTSEGIATVALMQAMEESCRDGKPVKVRDVLARHGLDRFAST